MLLSLKTRLTRGSGKSENDLFALCYTPSIKNYLRDEIDIKNLLARAIRLLPAKTDEASTIRLSN